MAKKKRKTKINGVAAEGEDSYLRILVKTKGKWIEDWAKLRKKRRTLELSASKKRKKAW